MQQFTLSLLQLIGIDLLLLLLILLLLIPLCYVKRATYAILVRNFVGYFSNPTGYVFLCLFVWLTSMAAFWPNAFFNSNLANLDQLNRYLPFIMLIFIPAITMSIWSEERRQGTDELLLTLPAGDFDVVTGKYLAAAAIFTASLLFSQISNYVVLLSLTYGNLDAGLFVTTYLGYWLAGLAMLAIGMVASFLTSNMTVGFILGALFNAPLAFAAFADTIIPTSRWARLVYSWSMSAQLDNFGRGVISLSSILYFLMLIVVGLYLSMVLIGRRHWVGGRDGQSLFGHYLARGTALIVIAISANVVFGQYDLRYDATDSGISSLSPDTRSLLKKLKPKHPIFIDAFVSGEVPEDYVETKLDLISMLREFDSASGEINVRIFDNLEPFSEQADLAEEQYGIAAQTVRTRSRGAIKDQEIILGAAITCGLEKVVIPFFEYGIPVEYELVRSISTVAKGERKKLGVLRNDANLMGGFTFAGGQPQSLPKHLFITELEKQYDVEEVDPSNPIELDTYDALMAVQPSSLSPPQLENLITAVKAGLPTAIFEDPAPVTIPVPGTGQPKQQQSMFGGPPPQKCDIEKLWDAIGIDVKGQADFQGMFQPDVAWQRYNPYPKLQIENFSDQWVFASNQSPGGEDALNPEERITAGLVEVMFLVPGAFEKARDSKFEFTKLVSTGDMAGVVTFEDFVQNQADIVSLRRIQGRPSGKQVLAAHITGEETDGKKSGKETKPTEDTKKPEENDRPLNVIYVADCDVFSGQFLQVRGRPDLSEEGINWQFDNVTFALNLIDVLTGDTDYIGIRKRKSKRFTLQTVEDQVNAARELEDDERQKFEADFKKAEKEAEKESKKTYADLSKAVEETRAKEERGEQIDVMEFRNKVIRLGMQEQVANHRLELEKERLRREREERVKSIRRDMDLQIQKIQNTYKFWAVVIPPIPPLLVGLIVFVRRRLREREGVSKVRLR